MARSPARIKPGQPLQLDLFERYLTPLPPSATPTATVLPVVEVPASPAEPGESLDDVLRPVYWRHPRANRECRLGDLVVAYECQRGQRRTIGLTVSPQGLSVRVPRWAALVEVDAFLQRKADWVLSKLKHVQEQQRLAPEAQCWLHGAELSYLGRSLTLTLDPSHAFEGRGACVREGQLLIGLAHDAGPDRVREVALAWLRREAEQLFHERLAHFAPLLGVRHSRLRLSSAGTRWGSASADGSIRLNWRLIHLSPELIDYVVVHELSHLREMNHSSAFWAVVASVMPDHAERRQALKRVRLPET